MDLWVDRRVEETPIDSSVFGGAGARVGFSRDRRVKGPTCPNRVPRSRCAGKPGKGPIQGYPKMPRHEPIGPLFRPGGQCGSDVRS